MILKTIDHEKNFYPFPSIKMTYSVQVKLYMD